MASDVPYRPSRLQDSALRWGPRIAVGTVLAAAAINWAGWATGIETLTRGFPSWPQMTPWSALLVALSGAAILLQTGRPTPARVWAGRALAALVGVVAATFLAEYAAGTSFSLDQVWFPDAVTSHQASWPGRPSPQTAGSVLLLSAANGLTRVDRRWTADVWALGLAAVALTPFVAIAAYMFDAVSLTRITPSTGMGISTALCLVLLVTAAVSARPDRNPLAWLLRRPDRWSLVRLLGVVAGLPIVTGLSRVGWLHLGLPDTPAWVLSIAVGTVVVGAATFYLSQHEQMLLIEKEKLSRERAEAERERAEAEARYRILADNSVDVVLRLR
ncbi:MAG: Diguanylate cyclase, partial [Pseudomonadota bacterium]|nr:Diguanylate cyclase [Pseudomonadota bacterium]